MKRPVLIVIAGPNGYTNGLPQWVLPIYDTVK